MTRLRGIVAIVCVASALCLAASAGASGSVTRVEWVHHRAWTVTLTYTVRSVDSLSQLRSLHLEASVGASTRIDRVLPLPSSCLSGGCEVLEGAHLLEVHDLGGGAPTAVVWLWTGGAHCCSIVEYISLRGGRVRAHNFGNPGATIRTIEGTPMFVSQDDRFSYLYTSYAASGRPLQLWRLQDGRLVDVTPAYRGAIAKDARFLWGWVQRLRRQREDVRGFFAAWAADACRLGGRARVEMVAASFVRAGVFSPPLTEPGSGPTGARFPDVLLRDLTRWGYCKPA